MKQIFYYNEKSNIAKNGCTILTFLSNMEDLECFLINHK